MSELREGEQAGQQILQVLWADTGPTCACYHPTAASGQAICVSFPRCIPSPRNACLGLGTDCFGHADYYFGSRIIPIIEIRRRILPVQNTYTNRLSHSNSDIHAYAD